MLREMFCALESPTRSPSLSFPGIACATSRERLSPERRCPWLPAGGARHIPLDSGKTGKVKNKLRELGKGGGVREERAVKLVLQSLHTLLSSQLTKNVKLILLSS